MTDNEIRIAIAEKRGWIWYRRPATGPWEAKLHRSLYNPSLVPEYTETLQLADMTERECNSVFIFREGLVPDYPNDLNAMHEAEKMLNERQGGDYDMHLWLIIKRDKTRPACWHTSARQRAEAFCRTLGIWKE